MHLYYGAKIGDADVSCLFPRAERSFRPTPRGTPGGIFRWIPSRRSIRAAARAIFASPAWPPGTAQWICTMSGTASSGASRRLRACPPAARPPRGGNPGARAGRPGVRAVCQAAVRCVRGGRFFTRSAVIVNRGAAPHPCTGPRAFVWIFRQSPGSCWGCRGAWARERQPERQPLRHGVQGFGSKRGLPATSTTPFFALCAPHHRAFGPGLRLWPGLQRQLRRPGGAGSVRYRPLCHGHPARGLFLVFGPRQRPLHPPEAVLAFPSMG